MGGMSSNSSTADDDYATAAGNMSRSQSRLSWTEARGEGNHSTEEDTRDDGEPKASLEPLFRHSGRRQQPGPPEDLDKTPKARNQQQQQQQQTFHHSPSAEPGNGTQQRQQHEQPKMVPIRPPQGGSQAKGARLAATAQNVNTPTSSPSIPGGASQPGWMRPTASSVKRRPVEAVGGSTSGGGDFSVSASPHLWSGPSGQRQPWTPTSAATAPGPPLGPPAPFTAFASGFPPAGRSLGASTATMSIRRGGSQRQRSDSLAGGGGSGSVGGPAGHSRRASTVSSSGSQRPPRGGLSRRASAISNAGHVSGGGGSSTGTLHHYTPSPPR